MSKILLVLVAALMDVIRAAWHILSGRKRVIYAATVDIAAPRHAVWDLLLREDVTYAESGLRYVLEPIANLENAYIATMTLKDKPLGRIGTQYLEIVAQARLVSRYLPEFTDNQSMCGDQDHVVMIVSDLPGGGTHLAITRELTHNTPATRITAPMGIRQAVHLVKSQAELEAGVPPTASSRWYSVGWTAAAFASFALIMGWRDALLVMAIIAVHEAGHALAMLRYGLGVRIVSFVPFFGGVAVPKRAAESEWQRGIVALMGVGFSLPFMLALLWLARHYQSAPLAHAAALFGFINAFNLIPFPGLDGSVVVQMLLRKLHPALARVFLWMMLAAACFAAYTVAPGDPVIWVLVAFMAIVVVQSTSVDFDAHLRPANGAASLLLLAMFLSLCAAYAVASIAAVHVELDVKHLLRIEE